MADDERYRAEVSRLEADYRATVKQLNADTLRELQGIIEAATSLEPAQRAQVVAAAERLMKAIRDDEQLSTLLTVEEGIALRRRAGALADNDPREGA